VIVPGLYTKYDGTLYEVIGLAQAKDRHVVVCKEQRTPYDMLAIDLVDFEAEVKVKNRMVRKFTILRSF
jgi:hypothetical protein